MCVCFFFFRTYLSQCNGGVKNLVLRLISAIWSKSLSVLALNFSVILKAGVD